MFAVDDVFYVHDLPGGVVGIQRRLRVTGHAVREPAAAEWGQVGSEGAERPEPCTVQIAAGAITEVR